MASLVVVNLFQVQMCVRYPLPFTFSGSDIVLQLGSLLGMFRRNYFLQFSGLEVEEMSARERLVPTVGR
jgi:hypothetical protein